VRGVESGSATRSPSFSADCPGIVVGEVEEREAGEAEGVEISCGRAAAATDVEQWPADKTVVVVEVEVVVVVVVVDNVGCDSGVPAIFPGGGNDRYAIPLPALSVLASSCLCFSVSCAPRNVRRISPCPSPPAGPAMRRSRGWEVAGVTDGAHPRQTDDAHPR